MVYSLPRNHESEKYFLQTAVWEWTFAWLPHRCQITNKLIWFEYAYRGVSRIGDYMDPVFIIWRKTSAHIFQILKDEK